MGMAEPAEAGGGLTEVHLWGVRPVTHQHLPNETVARLIWLDRAFPHFFLSTFFWWRSQHCFALSSLNVTLRSNCLNWVLPPGPSSLGYLCEAQRLRGAQPSRECKYSIPPAPVTDWCYFAASSFRNALNFNIKQKHRVFLNSSYRMTIGKISNLNQPDQILKSNANN